MKNKSLIWMMTAMLGVSMLTGCQKEEEEVVEEAVQEEVVEEEEQEPEMITLGEENQDAIALCFKNSTGRELTGYWMRLSAIADEETGELPEEAEWGDNMMTEDITVPAGEVFLVYYLPDENAETTEDALLCDISWGYADGTYVEIDELDVLEPDMVDEQYIELCVDAEASYVKYTSTYTGEVVDNKDAVLAKIAEEQALAEAEALAAEEAAAASAASSSNASSSSSSSGSTASSSASTESTVSDTVAETPAVESAPAETVTPESSAPAEETVSQPQQPSIPEGVVEECGHYFDAAGNEVFLD